MDMNIYDESKGCFETKESIKVKEIQLEILN
jgi:hypothetical protein